MRGGEDKSAIIIVLEAECRRELHRGGKINKISLDMRWQVERTSCQVAKQH